MYDGIKSLIVYDILNAEYYECAGGFTFEDLHDKYKRMEQNIKARGNVNLVICEIPFDYRYYDSSTICEYCAHWILRNYRKKYKGRY